MKKFLLYLAVAYLAVSVQAVFFRGVKPDFVLVLVCFYSLKHGGLKGAGYGALTGLLIDTVNGFVLGPHILGKSLAAFLVRAVRENIFQWNIVINTLAVTVLSVVNIFIVYICLETFAKISFVNRPWSVSAREVVYTIAASLALYAFFRPERENGSMIQG